ncbi:hypothetical protein PF005_g4068 [Phytophthora fragariae]|uniref:Protein kinase domain-containing protein n=1 Tax=Phytophthora fragariae TaxID=53985 RepID=A0A6A3Z280_9STRA|nr:hypothetical protein PF005_g4068 [Phytophthora fragariae]
MIQSLCDSFPPSTAPFQRFPASRYAFIRAYESPVHSRALQRQNSVVAVDLTASRRKQQVLLTILSKAAVTEWQLEHLGRVMAILERQPAVFQRLLQIYDAGNSWVLVQELRPEWTKLRESFADPAEFSEERLRRVVFQVAALVHFLHRHELSLAGELVHYDLVMENEQVTLLLHLDLILSGCILVPATSRTRDADVAAIGMLMFQMAMMPRSAKSDVDVRYVEGAIEEQLSHLSSACRDLLLDCLTMKLSVQDLLARKWLRQVDFLHTTNKLDGVLISPETRHALYNSLLWKLAALCMMDWLRRAHETPEGKITEEEAETESTRQRSQRPTRRIYTRSRLYVANGTTSSSDLTLLDAHMEHVTPNVLDIPGEDLELIRPIGHGAFGDAVLARWKSTSQDVVVKMMNQDVYRSSDALVEFRHEAAVMNLLGKHPHVVELLGVSSTGSSGDVAESRGISLVTEYLPNGSVEDVLGITADADSSSVSTFSRTVMARDAAHGLANIHQGNFLHRDIAARNCLVDAEFRVKVCDFGLSRRLRGSTQETLDGFLFDDDRRGFGPLKWMAPESITPPHLFSTYSDSYMFGVLLYEIFSGQPPFPNLSSRDAAALILEGHHVPIPSSMPSAHQQLMEKCFEVHPLHRPSMNQIYCTLDQWVLLDTKSHVASSTIV